MRVNRALLVIGVGAALAAACGSSNSGSTGFGNFDAGLPGLDAHVGLPDVTGILHHDAGFPKIDAGHHEDSGKKGDAHHDGTTSGGGDATLDVSTVKDSAPDTFVCPNGCSADFGSVVDCHGNVLSTCAAGTACDQATGTCTSACTAAEADKLSAGCEYYATDMDTYEQGVCFAAFVANTWTSAAHITVDYAGSPLSVGTFAFTPTGTGPSLTYTALDPVAGIAPGQMAILFLVSGSGSAVPCPKPAALTTAGLFGASGVSNSFHIVSDVPVAAYQINPYGGGSAAITGASLLLPTSAWDLNYIAVTVSPNDISGPSMNIIASQDNTTVTMTPVVAVAGGGTLPAGPASTPYTFTLNAGQEAQFSQAADLTGSSITASAPIGFMAGQPCMREPVGVAYCDHGEQMIPPAHSLGTEYVGVMYRPRVTGDEGIWRLVGAADGTTLTYSPSAPAGAPTTLSQGESITFNTATPFIVTSQDTMHPFMMFTYMSGSQWSQLSNAGGYGDPDMVLDVPPAQFLTNYVFFADPTYPETDVVVIREANGATFEDVTLDCGSGAGVLTGWQTVGAYQWTRVDLQTGNFTAVNGCSTGRHEISSPGKFGIQVWGWGTPLTSSFTANVSYGYPGGMNVQKINRL